MLPMAVQIGSARAGSPRRAAQHLLVVGRHRHRAAARARPRAGCWSATSATARRRCSAGCHRDGRCGRWSRPSSRTRPGRRWLGSLVVDRRRRLRIVAADPRGRRSTPGRASLAAQAAATVGVVLIALAAWTVLPAPQPPLPTVDLRARPRLAALDSFDHVVRPFALRYAPVRLRRRAAHRADAGRRASRPDCGPSRSRCGCCTTAVSRCRPGSYRVRGALGGARSAAGPRADRDRAASGPHRPAAAAVAGDAVARRRQLGRGVLAAGRCGLRRLPRHPELERSIDELRIEAIDVADAGAPHTDAASARGGGIRRHDRALPRRVACIRSARGFWTAGGAARACDDRLPGRLRGRRRPCVRTAAAATEPAAAGRRTAGARRRPAGETSVPVQVPPVAGGGAIELGPRDAQPASSRSRSIPPAATGAISARGSKWTSTAQEP